MKLIALLPVVTLSACAAMPVSAEAAGASPILHYLRSNTDGSQPEHVVQYRPSPADIAVYKWVRKCATAAYVTARMASGTAEASRYTAGKVAQDGSQASFATLELDGATNSLNLSVRSSDGPPQSAKHALKQRPYIIYDFDFADLNAALQENPRALHFKYAFPVLWPTETGFGFKDLGVLTGRFEGDEQRQGYKSRRYRLTVEGPQPAEGALWIEAERGFVVEAQLSLPNHSGYRDFRLRLEKAEPGSRAAWQALTRSHYAACPTGN
jgi:hypothetical protein